MANEPRGNNELVLELLKGIDKRMERIEHRLEQNNRDFVPRELFNNLVAEVESIAERVDILEAKDSKESGKAEIIGKLVWPVVTALVIAFVSWLGLGKKIG